MVGDKEIQVFHTIDDHTVVVDQIFTIEKVIGRQ